MKILVTGASGGVGFELMMQLASEGCDVRAMSRSPLRGEIPPNVEGFIGDPTDEGSLGEALAHVDGVFIGSVFLDDIETARNVSRVVHGAAVPRVVLLSSLCTFTRDELVYANLLRDVVGEIRSRNPHTVSIHPGQFASNSLRWSDMVRSGTVVQPFGDVRMPVIDPFDIAAVAKVGFVRDGYEGESFKITGSDSLTPRERVSIIADATGREIEFVEISEAQARVDMGRFLGPDLLDYYIAMNGYPKPSEVEVLPTVEMLTGRRPRSFGEWLEGQLEAFL